MRRSTSSAHARSSAFPSTCEPRSGWSIAFGSASCDPGSASAPITRCRRGCRATSRRMFRRRRSGRSTIRSTGSSASSSDSNASRSATRSADGPFALSDHHPSSSRLPFLVLAALGVVYGDIGTSPLYALRECFAGTHPIPVTPENVLGVLSLIFWSLIVTVSVKYLLFVMRADNQGEGGILALVALLRSKAGQQAHLTIIAAGLFGAALLYGDGMITPAISVLSAVEGLGVATQVFEPFVVPITIVILVGLFLVQSRGTAGIGRVFGPVMIVWFVTIAGLGLPWIWRNPAVLSAI